MSGVGHWLLDHIVFPLIWLLCLPSQAPSEHLWYRQWRGGHWERWILDSPVNSEHWFNHAYCQEKVEGDFWSGRPGLGRGTPRCEEWPVGGRWSILGLGRTRAYLSYVLRHKWYVARAGWRCADTLFERWLCVLHDNNKFHPAMWGPYATHFYLADGRSRNTVAADGFYKDVDDDRAFDAAWLWHIRRSKHHPQYWCDVVALPCHHWTGNALLEDDGGVKCLEPGCGGQWQYEIYGQSSYDPASGKLPPEVTVVVREMPTCYVTEMLCDWMGAGLAQGKPDTLGWYRARGYRHPRGKRTRALVERRLGYVREEVAS